MRTSTKVTPSVRRSLGGLFGLLGCAAALMSCQPELQVRLASASETLPAPGFVITDPEHPADRPRYNTVQVLQADGHVVWHLRAEPFGDQYSVARVTYGEAPSGFTAVTGPEALQTGQRYTVSVVGVKRGTLRFDVDAASNVRAVAE